MGLSPKVRWLMHLSFWTGVLYAFLALGLIVILAFGAYPPTAAAAPAFLLLLLFVAPSFVLFTSIFNFIFFCKLSSSQDVDDVVGQVVCNVGSLVALWPSLLVSAIPGVRDSVVRTTPGGHALASPRPGSRPRPGSLGSGEVPDGASLVRRAVESLLVESASSAEDELLTSGYGSVT